MGIPYLQPIESVKSECFIKQPLATHIFCNKRTTSLDFLEILRNPSRHHHLHHPTSSQTLSMDLDSTQPSLLTHGRRFGVLFLRSPPIQSTLISTLCSFMKWSHRKKMILFYLNNEVSIYTTITHTFTIIVRVVAASQSPVVEFLRICFRSSLDFLFKKC